MKKYNFGPLSNQGTTFRRVPLVFGACCAVDGVAVAASRIPVIDWAGALGGESSTWCKPEKKPDEILDIWNQQSFCSKKLAGINSPLRTDASLGGCMGRGWAGSRTAGWWKSPPLWAPAMGRVAAFMVMQLFSN